jgi:hypothetical protein
MLRRSDSHSVRASSQAGKVKMQAAQRQERQKRKSHKQGRAGSQTSRQGRAGRQAVVQAEHACR